MTPTALLEPPPVEAVEHPRQVADHRAGDEHHLAVVERIDAAHALHAQAALADLAAGDRVEVGAKGVVTIHAHRQGVAAGFARLGIARG